MNGGQQLSPTWSQTTGNVQSKPDCNYITAGLLFVMQIWRRSAGNGCYAQPNWGGGGGVVDHSGAS